MEGYTNVVGAPYDFDDLDIEGRVVDEWNVQGEEKKTSRIPGPKFDDNAILSEQVKLDNGHQANVFSVAKRKDNSTLYVCHICTDTLVGVASLRQHVQTQKHRANLSKPSHPRAKFVKLDPKENLSLEPGEPVPPGLEEVIVKKCAIQSILDEYKTPLIGLEYLVELTGFAYEEEYYFCLLCEKTGGERNMLIHLTSIYHNLKYLSMFFPTVAKKLYNLPNRKMKKAFSLVVVDIVGDIEAKFGRMKPFMEARSDFDAPGRMLKLQEIVAAGPHLREKDGECFDEKATAEYVDKKAIEHMQSVSAAEKVEGNKENNKEKDNTPTGSIFNKSKRFDKKQLRSREDEACNSSPDVEIVKIELPKGQPPPVKKKSRSRSLSLSTLSSSSSKGRSRLYRHHRQNSRERRRDHSRSQRRSRSRTRSPYSRHRRRSPYSRRYSPRRSRDRSPYRRKRNDSPDDRHRERLDRYGRSRDMYESRSEKSRSRRPRPEDRDKSIEGNEKIRWEKFREELKEIESSKLEKLKYYEKNPEKHPQYPEEWKSFWNRRYNELQRSGIDPSKHDFKPEWISFWTKRMKELYEEDLNLSKKDLKNKYDLPDDLDNDTPWKQKSRRHNSSPGLVDVSPPTPDKKDVIADIKSTWKALTGSDIRDAPKRSLSPWEDDRSPPPKRGLRSSRSPSPGLLINEKLLEEMPQRKARTSSLIFVLRKLTVLEQQLGYLAPKVFELMQQALALEKIKEEASLDLLFDSDNAFYLETVREKLIALLCAGVVPRNMVNTARSAIKHIDIALYLVTKRERTLPNNTMLNKMTNSQYIEPPAPDPVVVPGVGQVDKAAIAQQIATALIEQGRTNVTEAELGQLINAVVGMAEASANTSQPMTTANFLQQLQIAQNSCLPTVATTNVVPTETVTPVLQPTSQMSSGKDIVQTKAPNSQVNAGNTVSESKTSVGGLKLLQSAYNDSSKAEQESPKPDIIDITSSTMGSPISDEKLAATLAMFNNTSQEDQPNFVQKLKTSNPELYKRLCPFIPVSALISPDHSKRSPIIISLSKAKSEQKIKPVSSGRLSPFSSRTGGANPTIGERMIDIDEDMKPIHESPSTPKHFETNKGILSSKSSNIELEDDDDDDYSFEDVYKAAQERLNKQKEIDEDLKGNQPIKNVIDSTGNTKLNDPPSKTIDESRNSDEREVGVFNVQQNPPEKPNLEEVKNKTQQSEYEKYRELQSLATDSGQYPSSNPVSQDYQDIKHRNMESSQTYPMEEDYPNDSAYSRPNAADYDKNRQYSQDDQYYSNTGSYSNQSRDKYTDTYSDSYGSRTAYEYRNNNSSNPEYGSNTSETPGYGSNTSMKPGYGSNTPAASAYRNNMPATSGYGNNTPVNPGYGNTSTTPGYGNSTSTTPGYGNDVPVNSGYGINTPATPGFGSNTQVNPRYGTDISSNAEYGNNQANSGYGRQTNSAYGNTDQTSLGYGDNVYGGDPYRYRQQSAVESDHYTNWSHNQRGPPQRFPNYPSY